MSSYVQQKCFTAPCCLLLAVGRLKTHSCHFTFTLHLLQSWPQSGLRWQGRSRCQASSSCGRCWILKHRPHLGEGVEEGAHFSRAAGWRQPRPLISYHEVLCLSDVRQHQYRFHPTLWVWRGVWRANWNRLQIPPKIETTLESVGNGQKAPESFSILVLKMSVWWRLAGNDHG